MRLSAACQTSLLCIAVLFLLAEISTAGRARRQIIFEDEVENKVVASDCRTPDRRPGRCIRLTNCRVVAQTVSRNRLRRYICGFEGDEPKVCCPQPREEATTRRPTLVWTTTTRPRLFPTTTTLRPRLFPTTIRPTVRTTQRTTTTTRRTAGREEGRNGGIPLPDKPAFLPRKCGVSKQTLTRVIGGTPAERGAWPWLAVVFVKRMNGKLVPDCGGALVTNQHVVTAAHCVVSGRRSAPLDPSRIVVRLGAYNLSNPNEPDAIDVEVDSVRRHEEFESRTYKNDIAVLRLKRPVRFNGAISPVCLPYDSLNGEDLTGKASWVIGYGTTAFNGNSSDVIMQAQFPIQSDEVCRRAYEPEVTITHVYMCAGTMDGSKDACQGDSGGPLLAIGKNTEYYLVGVVSFGKQCGLPRYPGVYARVTAFLDWLSRHLSQ